MLIAGRDIEGIGLGTAQFAFREGNAGDSVATVHAARPSSTASSPDGPPEAPSRKPPERSSSTALTIA
jgi:hypothetical protein